MAACEPLVGTAPKYDVYLLFECPLPWHFTAMESVAVPKAVRQFFAAFDKLNISIRPLLICDEETSSRKKARAFLYRKVGTKYRGWAFQLECLEQLPEIVLKNLDSEPPQNEFLPRQLFVCTHAARDECCGKTGYPVYQALRRAACAKNAEVNVWRVSHIGGHRFAATLLSLPEGRYYGRLSITDAEPFLDNLLCDRVYAKCYRGLGALDKSAQAFEACRWKKTVLEHVDKSNAALSWRM